MVKPEAMDVLFLFQHYKNNYLLEAGGLNDQPALYLEIMEMVEREWAEQ